MKQIVEIEPLKRFARIKLGPSSPLCGALVREDRELTIEQFCERLHVWLQLADLE